MAGPGYDYQRRYYQVRHKPLTVHSVEVKGNERTKAGLLANVLEPVRSRSSQSSQAKRTFSFFRGSDRSILLLRPPRVLYSIQDRTALVQ